ncbi:MAG: polysaccharide deacetylase family protein [Planctomycetaceae bacterium]|nr:polysaccharide deacetylase family protein [Planctomycetaceae bacterium]
MRRRLFAPEIFVCRLALVSSVFLFVGSSARPADPIPDRLVVLTFDDSALSHYTVAAPLLRDYGFGATFFITEGFDFRTNKQDYMTWEQIAELHRMGFEIGNHTRDHVGINDAAVPRLAEQLDGINEQCRKHGIPQPVTFAWPANATSEKAFAGLRQKGIVFARRGGTPEYPYDKGRGFAYEPGRDHSLLVPSAGDARPDWTMQDLIRAVSQAKDGRVAVLQFHGVPDTAHSWVNSPQQQFEAYMKYLSLNDYTVIALRDLRKYVSIEDDPADPQKIIRERQTAVRNNAAHERAAPKNGVRDQADGTTAVKAK